MVVVTGDHPADEVGRPRRHPGFDHFGDGDESLAHSSAASLGNLQVDEGRHGISDATDIDLGTEPGDHAAFEQAVEMSLSGITSHAHLTGEGEHPCPRRGTESLQQT